MKKIIVTMMMMLLPLVVVAQEMKIAYVIYLDIINVMPEVTQMESEMAAFRKQYEDNMKSLEDDYTRKITELQAAGDSLTENIRNMLLKDLQDHEMRMQNFAQVSQQDFEKKQGDLLTPIQEKIQKAINEVGDENNYAYIHDSRTLLYMNKSAINATPQVKAKLGLN